MAGAIGRTSEEAGAEAIPKKPISQKGSYNKRVFDMLITNKPTTLTKAQRAEGPVSNRAQREHEEFLTKGKRKKVLLKDPYHDSKVSAMNHLSNKESLEIELLKTVQKLADLKRELSSVRRDTCIMQDFTIQGLFGLFDKKQKGQVGLQEAEYGFSRFGIYSHKSDICLLLKTFDRKARGVLDFEDFFCMVVPQDKEIRELVESRSQKSVELDFIQSISKDTFQSVQTTLEKLLDYAIAAECLKQRLIFDKAIDLTQAFMLFPKKNKKFITAADVINDNPVR